MKVTNLQRIGIDTDLEKTLTLTIKGDVRADFQSVFRVLKRLTAQYTFGDEEAHQLVQSLKAWRPSIQLADTYTRVDPQDLPKVSQVIGFSNKEMIPVSTLISDTTILCIYDGKPFRGHHIFTGRVNRAVALPSGAQFRDVFLITRQAAILLNWAQMTYGIQPESNPTWSSAYPDQTDLSYFGVLAHFIFSKFNAINARHHKEPLTKILTDFYVDYLATFSVTLQTREESRLNGDSVAKSFETKKNIPQYIQARMDQTSLNRHFNFIELDEEVDMALLDNFESQVTEFFRCIPSAWNRKVQALRLRKLGKHSSQNKTTTGLYYPQVDNIVVDLRDVKSFGHEWGHALDHGMDNLSKQSAFLDHIYPSVVSRLTKIDGITPDMKAYYCMPTEVFARMFEWFMVNQHGMANNSCFSTIEDYHTNPIYTAYDWVAEDIQSYFNNL